MTIVATAEPVSPLAQDGHGSHEILMYTDQVNRTEPTMAINLTSHERLTLLTALEDSRKAWSRILEKAEAGQDCGFTAAEAQGVLQDIEYLMPKVFA